MNLIPNIRTDLTQTASEMELEESLHRLACETKAFLAIMKLKTQTTSLVKAYLGLVVHMHCTWMTGLVLI